RYTGGYYTDPSLTKSVASNWAWFQQDNVVPKRLPKTSEELLDATNRPLLPVRYSHAWHQTEPYDPTNDRFPIGTVISSVLWIENPDLDRADVAAVGHWRDGYWTLETARAIKSE